MELNITWKEIEETFYIRKAGAKGVKMVVKPDSRLQHFIKWLLKVTNITKRYFDFTTVFFLGSYVQFFVPNKQDYEEYQNHQPLSYSKLNTALHEAVHVMDASSNKISFAWKYLFDSKQRMEYELRAYSVKLILDYVYKESKIDWDYRHENIEWILDTLVINYNIEPKHRMYMRGYLYTLLNRLQAESLLPHEQEIYDFIKSRTGQRPV
jgi:hypothetical protein